MIASVGHLITLGGWTLAALTGLRLAFGLYRVCPRTKHAWRYLPAALSARIRWRWMTRALNLAYLDQHRRATRRPTVPFGTSVKVKAPAPGQHARLRFPRAAIRPDDFGIYARVRTIPRVGRSEFDDSAEHIANAWRCIRLQVSQPKPGRIELRGIRRDPLLTPLDHDGTWPAEFPRSLPLGVDEFGQWRTLPLGRNVTGVTIAGLPGSGKTSLVNGWLGDLAGTAAAQFVILDGKGGADFDDWQDRALVLTGDELADADDALTFAHDLMRDRLGQVVTVTGARNAWSAGHPSARFPLLVVIIDEAANYFDPSHFKGDRKAEDRSRRCVGLTSQLIRRGGSVAVLVVLITQKITGDAVPTVLRDNSALAVAFALKTTEASVAALGEAIRKHPTYDPTTLQGPDHVGVCVASLRTGLMPYVRLRVPYLTEEAAAARAASTAEFRLSPEPTPVPAPSRHLAEVPALATSG